MFNVVEWLSRALASEISEPALTDPAIQAAISDSLARIRHIGETRRRFAIVSSMPPSETGIAYATAKTFRNCPGGVDIFSRFEDIQAYASFASEASSRDAGFDVFDIAALPLAIGTRVYDAIIVELGNSWHNRFICACLTHFAKFPSPIPLFIHAHDPFLLDIWEWFAKRQGRSQSIDMRLVYGCRWSGVWGPLGFARARKMGIAGLSAVLRDISVAGIIVNSAAASDIVSRDLARAGRALPVLVGFHPVFPATRAAISTPRDKTMRVGSFGVPASWKRTDVILDAIKALIARGVDCQLVLAGFGVDDYMARRPAVDRARVRLVNSPSDAALMSLMAEVDVAVQLRRSATGESSGVVSQLMAMGRPVVVSAVGAFMDFGDAVVQVGPEAGPDAVADAILSASDQRALLEARAKQYCASRGPEQYVAWLADAINNIHGVDTSRELESPNPQEPAIIARTPFRR